MSNTDRRLVESTGVESGPRPVSSKTRVKRSFLERLKIGVQSSKLISCTSNARVLSTSSEHRMVAATGYGNQATSDVTVTTSKRQRLVADERVNMLHTEVTANCSDVTATCSDHDNGLRRRRRQCTSSMIQTCNEHETAGGGCARRHLRHRRYTRVDVIHQTDEIHWKESTMMGDMTSQWGRYPDVTPARQTTSFKASKRIPSDPNVFKGEVKLSFNIQPKGNLINIHVKELRHLECSPKAEQLVLETMLTSGYDRRVEQRHVCCVKVSDSSCNRLMNTDEHITLRLRGKDNNNTINASQTIQLSISSTSCKKSRPRFIGSVLFDVNNLIAKCEQLNGDQLHGWYHLTSKQNGGFDERFEDDKENVGPSPSVPVKSRDSRLNEQHVTVLVGSISSQSSSSSCSYGFTLLQDNETHLDCRRSARVATVISSGPAAEAGLLPGDQLVAINGLDVTGCSASSVMSIINRTAVNSRPVTLEIVRKSSTGSGKSQLRYDSLLHSDTGYFTLHQSRDCRQLTFDQSRCDVQSTDLADDTSEYDCNSSLLNDARFESHVYDALDDVTDTSSLTRNGAGTWSRDVSRQLLNDVNNNDGVSHDINFVENRGKTTGKSVDDVTAILTASPIRPFRSELDRYLLDLMTLERDFIVKMTSGIQTFSRPLRHHVIQSSDHGALFQNVEKLVALSELHVSCLSSDGSQSLPEVYQLTLDCLAVTYSLRRLEAYTIYLSGLPNAFHVLSRLQQNNRKFVVYVTNVPCSITLVDFLKCPVAYLEQLAVILNNILACSTQNGANADHVTTLKMICEGILHTSSTFENRSCLDN